MAFGIFLLVWELFLAFLNCSGPEYLANTIAAEEVPLVHKFFFREEELLVFSFDYSIFFC